MPVQVQARVELVPAQGWDRVQEAVDLARGSAQRPVRQRSVQVPVS